MPLFNFLSSFLFSLTRLSIFRFVFILVQLLLVIFHYNHISVAYHFFRRSTVSCVKQSTRNVCFCKEFPISLFLYGFVFLVMIFLTWILILLQLFFFLFLPDTSNHTSDIVTIRLLRLATVLELEKQLTGREVLHWKTYRYSTITMLYGV